MAPRLTRARAIHPPPPPPVRSTAAPSPAIRARSLPPVCDTATRRRRVCPCSVVWDTNLRDDDALRSRPGLISGLLLAAIGLVHCRADRSEPSPPASPVPLPSTAFRVQWGSAGLPRT